MRPARILCPNPQCGGPRKREHYLCRACWFRLPAETRKRLWRCDEFATVRLRELLRALRAGTPLEQIEVAA